ncbi:hypothetical protein B9Z19DRAFT_1078285 [Tuber borchii]|uniref:Uncharacterized protein n=1 Tax=Tuber borchii TaxID=42251 RepID=A0A2T6ZZT4_TUBBO|nr:hypothetical protein B9Z19DRAFT_1078285 [Tuber borchii]
MVTDIVCLVTDLVYPIVPCMSGLYLKLHGRISKLASVGLFVVYFSFITFFPKKKKRVVVRLLNDCLPIVKVP